MFGGFCVHGGSLRAEGRSTVSRPFGSLRGQGFARVKSASLSRGCSARGATGLQNDEPPCLGYTSPNPGRIEAVCWMENHDPPGCFPCGGLRSIIYPGDESSSLLNDCRTSFAGWKCAGIFRSGWDAEDH